MPGETSNFFEPDNSEGFSDTGFPLSGALSNEVKLSPHGIQQQAAYLDYLIANEVPYEWSPGGNYRWGEELREGELNG